MNPWLHSAADAWAEILWTACWQGALVIALVWLVCRSLPRLSPSARCWLWWLACLKLLLGLVPVTPLTESAAGWDAYEVWRRFIKDARDRRQHPE